MRCEQIMKQDVEYVSPDDTAQSAAKRMLDCNIGFLPVCDGTAKVVGTVTDRDLALRVLAESLPATIAISDVMTPTVISCSPKEDLRAAEDRMAAYQKSRMVCLDDNGCLVGVISLSDIAQRERGTRASETLRRVSQREARA